MSLVRLTVFDAGVDLLIKVGLNHMTSPPTCSSLPSTPFFPPPLKRGPGVTPVETI